MISNYKNILEKVDLQEFKNKTILITGANGLIGGFLTDFFVHLNDEHSYNINLILSSLSKDPQRLKHVLDKKYIKYFSKDLSSDVVWNIERVDYCFYCAGYAQPSKFIAQPMSTLLLNSIGLESTFSEVFKNKNAKAIYISSSEVYLSNKTKKAHDEKDLITLDITNRRSFYVLGKLNGEIIVNNLRAQGFNATSARVSLCYGPGVLADDSRVLSEIVQKGLSNTTTIKLFDDGSASRRYIHVADFAIMLFNITLNGSENVYNICGEEESTIYEIASMVANKLHKTVEKGVMDVLVSQTAPKVVWNSLEKYKKEFGDVEFKPLLEGVEEFVDWYRQNCL